MLLEPGAKLLICHRRLFAEDHPRFFIGTVDAFEASLVKVSGVTWARDPSRGFQSRHDRRTKIVALASGTLLVYELPREVDLEKLRIEQPGGHSVVLSDGGDFRMELAERM